MEYKLEVKKTSGKWRRMPISFSTWPEASARVAKMENEVWPGSVWRVVAVQPDGRESLV